MNYLLFTTTQCPKCPEIKKFVSEKVILPGRILNETMPDFGDLIGEHGVSAAPTMIVFEKGQEVFRGNEISEIEDFIKCL